MNKLTNVVLHGDCLDLMETMADGSVDMILCDLPYGTIAASWDSIIDFDRLWASYKRLIRRDGAARRGIQRTRYPFVFRLLDVRYERLMSASTSFNQARGSTRSIKSFCTYLFHVCTMILRSSSAV